MKLSVIIEKQRTAVRRDYDFLWANDGHLPVRRLGICRANDALRNFQLELVCAIGRESDRSASYHREDGIGSLRESG